LVLSLLVARLVACAVLEHALDDLHAGALILTAALAIELASPASYSLISLGAPLCLAGRALVHSSGAGVSQQQLVQLLPITVLFIGGPMSLCLHRYFAHRAFKTSRALQLVVGVGATLAFQGGPLWWAAMHVRHHKHCDAQDDPHSVTRQGFWYAWLGWMVDARNYAPERADVKTLDPDFARPELRAVQALHPLFPIGLCLFTQHSLGHSAMLWGVLVPMLLCRLITCLFNVEFHPDRAGATRTQCAAINDDRFLAKLVGESRHQDHHNNPRRARRPDWDLPGWATIAWMQPLGLVWDCR
jgi:stearoyl-CoA desaturase (delta-9 desaturase)